MTTSMATYEAITAYLDEKGIDAQDMFVEEYLNDVKTARRPEPAGRHLRAAEVNDAGRVMFDLDGTLTDSAPGILRSTRYALERLNADDGASGRSPSESELGWMVGPPLRESFARLVGADHVDPMLALYRERYDEVGMFENAVYRWDRRGARARSQARGYRLFVATSKLEADARPHPRAFRPRRLFRGDLRLAGRRHRARSRASCSPISSRASGSTARTAPS